MGTRLLPRAVLVLLLVSGCKINGTGKLPNGVPISSCDDCTFIGKPGVCLAREFDAARTALADPNFGDALNKAESSCDQEEVCILCNHPQTDEPTGACDLKPLACPDKVTVSSCDAPFAYTSLDHLESCGEGAHCMPFAYIDDEELRERVAACPQDPSKACVPDFVVQTAGNFTASTCTGLAGGEGRCLPTTFPQIAKRAALLPQSECAANERCSNCFDPNSGEDTGTCHMGCDPGPISGPVLYPTCAAAAGRCVDRARFNEDQAQYFEQRDCQANYYCVPYRVLASEFLNCVGTNSQDGNYLGSCLNVDLMQIENSDRLEDQGYCAGQFGANHVCVPCWRSTEPTGAPGCPKTPAEYTPDRLILE